jgi:hypothetical protein
LSEVENLRRGKDDGVQNPDEKVFKMLGAMRVVA